MIFIFNIGIAGIIVAISMLGSGYKEKTDITNIEPIGQRYLTAYAETGNNCADGVYPQTNFTVASNDPALWHRYIFIEGLGVYYVHDRGGMSTSVIDVYLQDYNTCIQFGTRKANVYLLE